MKRYIYLILLVFVAVACSIQRQQMSQVKSGLKDIPKRSFLNQSTLSNARKTLLKEIERVVGSDTIIIVESFVDTHGSYWCSLYSSNAGEIKRYHYDSDNYNAQPIVYYLKEEKVSNLVIDDIQLIRTDAYSYLDKIKSTKKTPSTTYIITIAKKVNEAYAFQYFSADD